MTQNLALARVLVFVMATSNFIILVSKSERLQYTTSALSGVNRVYFLTHASVQRSSLVGEGGMYAGSALVHFTDPCLIHL